MTGASPTLLDAFRPGHRVFVAGSANAPTGLLRAWLDDPDRADGLDIVTSLVPGINPFDLDRLPDSARVTGLFMRPDFAAAQRSGRYRHLPLSYGGMVDWVRQRGDFDICVVEVAPANDDGGHSMGLSVEFMTLAMQRARRVVGIVNHAMPRIRGAPTIGRGEIEILDERDDALPTYETGSIDAASRQIAAHIAAFIEDGATLQIGLGKVPAAISDALASRRGLRLHSGMIGDGVMGLAEAGALDPAWRHVGCVIVGRQVLYDWAGGRSELHVAGCEWTHAPEVIAGLNRLIAVNSALEVDLFGQANLENAGGAAISGPGGAPDFARGARLSQGGLSIVATIATAARGSRSRIVSSIGSPGLVTLGRHDVDMVVTEHGVADLRGCSVHERAEQIIAVAEPKFQPDLLRDWQMISARL